MYSETDYFIITSQKDTLASPEFDDGTKTKRSARPLFLFFYPLRAS